MLPKFVSSWGFPPSLQYSRNSVHGNLSDTLSEASQTRMDLPDLLLLLLHELLEDLLLPPDHVGELHVDNLGI